MKKFHLPALNRNGHILGFGTSAKRDWKILFYFGSVLASILIIYAVYAFYTLDTSEAKNLSVPSQGLVNEKLLKNVYNYYTGKAENLDEAKSPEGNIPDPSI